MTRRSITFTLLLGAAFLVGCLAGHRMTGAESPRAMLERVVAEYAASTSTHNPDDAVRLFRRDVVVLSPQSREPAVGVEANRAAWARFYSLPKAMHAIKTRDLVVSAAGDLAYTTGTWTASFERPDGTASSGDGELVTIWRRDPAADRAGGGEWRIGVVMAHRVR